MLSFLLTKLFRASLTPARTSYAAKKVFLFLLQLKGGAATARVLDEVLVYQTEHLPNTDNRAVMGYVEPTLVHEGVQICLSGWLLGIYDPILSLSISLQEQRAELADFPLGSPDIGALFHFIPHSAACRFTILLENKDLHADSLHLDFRAITATGAVLSGRFGAIPIKQIPKQ